MELVNLRLIFIFSPPIISMIVYYLSKYVVKHKRRAFHITIAWTTFLYIIIVTFLLEEMFPINFIGTMPIGLLVLLSIILIVQWRMRTEVILKNGLKILWRLTFLIFVPIYISLIVYQIVKEFT